MPKFVWSLALDFPHISPQFFLGNFSWQEGKKIYTQQCIFLRCCLPVKMASKTVIQFSALLAISAPFKCVLLISTPILMLYKSTGTDQPRFIIHLIAHKRTVFPHYKNSGVMSMWVYKVFKRMISFSNFVAFVQLVILARKDPGTRSPFSSLLDPLP